MAAEEESGYLVNVAKILSVAEHSHYPFKSYPRQACNTILFPGCSFPSQFPRTMDALSQLCRDAGFGVAYDCCGSPVAGFGEQKSADRIIRNLNRRFGELKCKRIVCVCPNCREFLAGKIDCEIVDFFDICGELDIGSMPGFGHGSLFIPCPDRKKRATEQKMRELCSMDDVATLDRAPCCGLRPDLASRGSAYSEKLGKKVIEQAGDTRIYTYCAACLGQFSRLGYPNCRHVVSTAIGIDEEPDSAHALANRAKRKFDRNTNPGMRGD